MILAKSVIKNKFWILEENAKRVGMMNFKDDNYVILKRQSWLLTMKLILRKWASNLSYVILHRAGILKSWVIPQTKKKSLMCRKLKVILALLKRPIVKVSMPQVGMALSLKTGG